MTHAISETQYNDLTKNPSRLYPKGQIILFANEMPDYVFYLASGRVRIYDISYRGEEVIVDILQAPVCFPLSWALNLTPNPYFYKAETDAVIHLVPMPEFIDYLRAHTDMLMEMLSKLYRSLDSIFGRLVCLMTGTAKSRLVYELVLESRRFGKLQPDGSTVIEVNESDIAARSGLSRETVSREIKKLRNTTLVEVRNRKIIIKNVGALEQSIRTLVPY